MNRRIVAWALACCAALLPAPAPAQAPTVAPKPKHVDFKVSVLPADPFAEANAASARGNFEARRGETFRVVLQGTPQQNWHTYPLHKHTEEQPTAQLSKVTLTDAKDFAVLGPVAESEPELVTVPGIGKAYEYEGPFTWTLEVLARPTALPGDATLGVSVELQVCDPNRCVGEKHALSVPVRISPKDAVALAPDVEKALREYDAAREKERAEREPKTTPTAAATAGGPAPGEPLDLGSYTVVNSPRLESAGGGKAAETGLWATIVTAVLGGWISLLTPCVFPMIPVTVSFFLKQGERAHHHPVTMASVYCATIVAVLTVGGIALVHVLQVISQHWITNVFLTVVFVYFALSLLGMYEITLPSGLANLTGSREGKGGLAGIVFMALTFSIISFACVGPIYGAFITLESQSSVTGWLQRVLGPLAFALAFASPFFVLALFPSLLRSMPKSGSWMNSVKVVMGFLELAAAFKFVRAAELNFLAKSEYFTYDLVMGIYIALCVACGLYLLNVYRLPHDH